MGGGSGRAGEGREQEEEDEELGDSNETKVL